MFQSLFHEISFMAILINVTFSLNIGVSRNCPLESSFPKWKKLSEIEKHLGITFILTLFHLASSEDIFLSS